MRPDAMHTSVYSKLARSKRACQAGILAVLLVTPGCTQTQREGLASSYLVIDSMAAASGAEPTKFGGVLASDVAHRLHRWFGVPDAALGAVAYLGRRRGSHGGAGV